MAVQVRPVRSKGDYMDKLDNLITPEELNARTTPEQKSANGKKANAASQKRKKELKTLRDITHELLRGKIKDYKSLVPLAHKAGIDTEKSVKELLVIVLTFNTLKKGNVNELLKFFEVLGENITDIDTEDLSGFEEMIFNENE